MIARNVILPIVAAFAVAASCCVAADEGVSASVRFRRILAPEDRVEDWPTGKEKYLPMDAAEFDRMTATPLSSDATTPAAAIASARYEARLADDHLVGKGSAHVVLVDAAPATAYFEPCNLAIQNAQWEAAEKGPPARAVLGLGGDGRLATFVERSGTLQFDWSSCGKRDSTGALSFSLELPLAAANEIAIELPEALTPILDRGLVIATESAGDASRRWRIALGGSSRLTIRILSEGMAAHRPQLALLRESHTYDFSARGVEVASQWRIQAHNVPLQQLNATLDPGLQLVSACDGDAPLSWTATPGEAGQPLQIALALKEPIRDTERVIRLVAFGRVEFDRPWRLPRVMATGLFWQEGNLTLLTPDPLMAKRIAPIGCNQTGIDPLSPPRAGSSVQFQAFQPDATVEVTLSRQPSIVQSLSATAVELGGEEAAARLTCNFRISEGARFTLAADVAPQWIVDAIESTPPGAVADWTLEPGENQDQRLSIRLAAGLTPTRPLRLAINARRAFSPSNERLGLDAFWPIRFRDVSHDRRLAAVRPGGAYALRLSGENRLDRLRAERLTTAELELFSETPRDLLFEYGEKLSRVEVALTPQRPKYAGEIAIDARFAAGVLHESCEIRIVPESGRVDRVLVQLYPRREESLRWMLGGEDERQVASQRWSNEEIEAAGVHPSVEVWELAFRHPRSVPFVISATREIAVAESTLATLASLPEATAQRGAVTVRSSDTTALSIDPRRLKPILPEVIAPGRVQTIRGVYRYDPARDVADGAAAALQVSMDAGDQEKVAWVWNCRLESWHQADGPSNYLATYDVQGTGRGSLPLTLPASIASNDICGIWVDGEPAEWRIEDAGERRWLRIELPTKQKFPRVVMQWKQSDGRLRTVGSLTPAMPTPRTPVLAQEWTAWLPPSYEAFGSDSQTTSAGASRSWSRRLFGPLGRSTEGGRFDPFSIGDWLAPVDALKSRQQMTANIERLLQTLGTAASAKSESDKEGKTPWTWGRLLGGESPAGALLRVVVDRQSLARANVTPQTPVRVDANDIALARGIGLLEEAGLTLLTTDSVAMLTSQTEASACRAYLAPLPHLPAWRVLPGPLADRIAKPEDASTPWLLPADAWSRLAADSRLVWASQDEPPFRSVGMRGWTAWRTDSVGAALPYAHTMSMRSLGIMVFLLCLGLGCWLLPTRPAPIVALLGVLSAIALLIPVGCVPIASGGVLGVLASFAWRWIRPRRVVPIGEEKTASAPGLRHSPGSTVSMIGQVGAMLIVASALSAGAVGWAQETPQNAAGETLAPYRVFVPIDAERKPTGGKVYLPETFYRELYRPSAHRAGPSNGWILSKAEYRGVLATDSTSGRLAFDSLHAAYDLRVFGAVRVLFPLGFVEAHWFLNGVLLDGQPIEPEWEKETALLTFAISESGDHRLEIVMRPMPREMGTGDKPPESSKNDGPLSPGVDLGIPRVAESRLELSIPDDAPSIEATSALGKVAREQSPSRLIADLGATDRLTVRWREEPGSATSGPIIHADQLIWLKFQPGSMVVAAKFKMNFGESRIQQVQLAVDSRLRLLPLAGNDAPTVQAGPEIGQTRLAILRWPHPVTGTVSLDTTFLLSGTAGIGKFRLPKIELLDARIGNRWLAVSVDPALDREEQRDDRLASLARSEFMKAWGASDVNPQAAYRLPEGDVDWSIATRPHEPRTVADQVLTLSCSDDHLDVLLEVQLSTRSGYLFQYQLAAPTTLTVESLSLLEDDVERAGRWSQADDGAITLFLNGAAAGQQRLVVRGRMPLNTGGAFPLPQMRMEGCEIHSASIRLFRRPSVLLEIDGKGQRPDAESKAIGVAPFDFGRFVESFTYDAAKPLPVTIAVTPNRPKVQGEVVVWPEWRGRSWHATLDCRLSVQGGLIDELEILAPSPWDGPYQANPPGQIRVRDVSGEGRRFVYRPNQAISGDYHLTISGPLPLGRGNRPTVPDIGIVSQEPLERLFLFPSEVEGRAARWHLEALTPYEDSLERDELSGESSEPPLRQPPLPGNVPADAPMMVYKASDEPVRAVLESSDTADGASFVRLADIVLSWTADGICSGAAAFDVEPNGAAECPVNLPTDCELIQASIEGVAVAPTREGNKGLRLPLGSAQIPQRVEILFQTRWPNVPQGGPHDFRTPTLGDLPVRQTLWTVIGPTLWTMREQLSSVTGQQNGQSTESTKHEETRQTSVAASGHRTPAWKQELLRLKAAVATIDSAYENSSAAQEETSHWYQRWAQRLVTAHDALRRELALVGASREVANARRTAEAIERQSAELATRLGVAELLGQLSKAGPVADGACEILRYSADVARPTLHLSFEGKAGVLALDCEPSQADWASHRLAAAFGIAALTLIIIVGMVRGRLAEICVRWRHTLGILLGLAWWLWLWPSAVGLLLSLCSVLAAGRRFLTTGK